MERWVKKLDELFMLADAVREVAIERGLAAPTATEIVIDLIEDDDNEPSTTPYPPRMARLLREWKAKHPGK